jgi:hypothetical protein
MIELISATIFLATSLYGGSTNTAVAQDINNSTNTQSKTPIENPVTLESYVRAYFAETPILAEISRCESQFRQYNSKGETIRGLVNKSDLGLMQVNEYYHGKRAVELGFDLNTVDGNLAYGKYLYDKEGTQPWSASKECWGKK